jgi:hypothetical protein
MHSSFPEQEMLFDELKLMVRRRPLYPSFLRARFLPSHSKNSILHHTVRA